MDKIDSAVPACESPVVPASGIPEDSCCVRLSDRDAAQVVASAENPPAPNPAALEAAKRYMQEHG
jgi:uncharacterized protein (DUF1778 family)